MALSTSSSRCAFPILSSSSLQTNILNSKPRPWRQLRLVPSPPLFSPCLVSTLSCRAHDGVIQQASTTSTLTLKELCHGRVPDTILMRAEEVGYVTPTDVQEQSLPVLLSRQDCVLHAQEDPPQIIVATLESLCQIIERHLLNLQSITILVIDEVSINRISADNGAELILGIS